ncbi:MAG: DUF1398 family protein [Burkholderiales bacterium]|nr:DUF1398 family protein [Burkholderiales bacterium]
MTPDILAAIEWAARSSKDSTAHFGEVVQALVAVGVERYHADYSANSTTYYLPSGESHRIALPPPDIDIAASFDAPAIVAAIRAAQRGEIMYPRFMGLSRAAGCVGYTVWIAGRHVSYFGRRGETHIEHFPN